MQLRGKLTHLKLYLSLYSAGIFLPFKLFRGWAIDIELADLIRKRILAKRPHVALELGSGSSTLLVGSLFKKMGQGKLISVEHDFNYYQKVKSDIEKYELTPYVSLHHAPLEPMVVAGQQFEWFNTDFLTALPKIDFLFVDSPPGFMQPLSRYPAMPMLAPYLHPDAEIILDDALRDDERIIAERWHEEFSQWEPSLIHTLKGAYMLKSQAGADNVAAKVS